MEDAASRVSLFITRRYLAAREHVSASSKELEKKKGKVKPSVKSVNDVVWRSRGWKTREKRLHPVPLPPKCTFLLLLVLAPLFFFFFFFFLVRATAFP